MKEKNNWSLCSKLNRWENRGRVVWREWIYYERERERAEKISIDKSQPSGRNLLDTYMRKKSVLINFYTRSHNNTRIIKFMAIPCIVIYICTKKITTIVFSLKEEPYAQYFCEMIPITDILDILGHVHEIKLHIGIYYSI